jgi:hypothetical protein
VCPYAGPFIEDGNRRDGMIETVHCKAGACSMFEIR